MNNVSLPTKERVIVAFAALQVLIPYLKAGFETFLSSLPTELSNTLSTVELSLAVASVLNVHYSQETGRMLTALLSEMLLKEGDLDAWQWFNSMGVLVYGESALVWTTLAVREITP